MTGSFVGIVIVAVDNMSVKYCIFNYFSKTVCEKSFNFSFQWDLIYLVSLGNFVGPMWVVPATLGTCFCVSVFLTFELSYRVA